MRLLNILLLLVLIAPPAHASNGDRIDITQTPWQVSVQALGWLRPDGSIVPSFHGCGGSIIGTRWIVTAAHCLEWMNLKAPPYKQIRVAAGASILSDLTQLPLVERVYLHPKYFHKEHYVFPKHKFLFLYEEFDNDIALIELSKDIIFGDTIQAIALDGAELKENDALFFSGWSMQKANDEDVDPNLRGFSIPYHSNNNLIEMMKEKEPLMSDQLTHPDTLGIYSTFKGCPGDSGGPVVRLPQHSANAEVPVLVGIPRTGTADCSNDGELSVTTNTRVSMFRTWIKEVTGI